MSSGEGNTLIEDIIEACEDTSSHRIPFSKWSRKHIFTGNPIGEIGFGAQNIGRTPFVRIYSVNSEDTLLSDGGGNRNRIFNVDIVISQKPKSSNVNSYELAYELMNEILTNLRGANNFLQLNSARSQELVMANSFYILQCTINVTNSYSK